MNDKPSDFWKKKALDLIQENAKLRGILNRLIMQNAQAELAMNDIEITKLRNRNDDPK